MARKHKQKPPEDSRQQQLIRIIEDAFGDRAYPGDDQIMVNPQHCPECETAYAFFQGTHWQRLLIEHDRLPTGYASIFFLTPEAQRFFLPAYLIAGLGYHQTDAVASAGGTALFLLTPDERHKGFSEFASGFRACYALW